MQLINFVQFDNYILKSSCSCPIQFHHITLHFHSLSIPNQFNSFRKLLILLLPSLLLCICSFHYCLLFAIPCWIDMAQNISSAPLYVQNMHRFILSLCVRGCVKNTEPRTIIIICSLACSKFQFFIRRSFRLIVLSKCRSPIELERIMNGDDELPSTPGEWGWKRMNGKTLWLKIKL